MKSKRQPLFYAARKLFGTYVRAVAAADVDYWAMSQDQLRRERSARLSILPSP